MKLAVTACFKHLSHAAFDGSQDSFALLCCLALSLSARLVSYQSDATLPVVKAKAVEIAAINYDQEKNRLRFERVFAPVAMAAAAYLAAPLLYDGLCKSSSTSTTSLLM